MKILHCLYDDKFTDGTIRTYNSDTRHTNKYIVIDDSNSITSFKYIKSADVFCRTSSQFLQLANDYDVVILHSLLCLPLECIDKIPSSCKVVWYAWGFDFYNNGIVKTKLYHYYTRRYFLVKNSFSFLKKNLLFYRRQKENYLKKRALYRIDYFSGVFPYEYELLKEAHPYIHAKPLDFYYGDVDFFVKDEVDYNINNKRQNIIIGNSGDPTNNHYDALLQLKRLNVAESTNIIIPLNYGRYPNYIKWVSKQARALFPQNAYILDKFLPLGEYLQLVSNCKAAIFFHERQQASDNILMQLMYGAKVYMSETSLAFQYLKKIGFKVFSLQKDIDSLMEGLSDSDIIYNRELLVQLYSASSIMKRIRVINEIIESDINIKLK